MSRARRLFTRAPRTTLAGALALGLALCTGCGGGPPRKPTPPRQDESLRRELFQVRGARDSWDNQLQITRGVKQIGGVQDCRLHEETGKFLVVYDPRRTHRDDIRQRIIELGQDIGVPYDPIFDDR